MVILTIPLIRLVLFPNYSLDDLEKENPGLNFDSQVHRYDLKGWIPVIKIQIKGIKESVTLDKPYKPQILPIKLLFCK